MNPSLHLQEDKLFVPQLFDPVGTVGSLKQNASTVHVPGAGHVPRVGLIDNDGSNEIDGFADGSMLGSLLILGIVERLGLIDKEGCIETDGLADGD